MMKVRIKTDGKAEPNPGVGTWGFTIEAFLEDDASKPVQKFAGYGKMPSRYTYGNNEMEYRAWHFALTSLKYIMDSKRLVGRVSDVTCFSDSDIMVKQNTLKPESNRRKGGCIYNYRVNPPLSRLWQSVRSAIKMLKVDSVYIHHVPREENTVADCLTNLAYDNLPAGDARIFAIPVDYHEAAMEAAIPASVEIYSKSL